MHFNYRDFDDLASTIRQNIWKLPEHVDLVVGIPRSGMIPAYMIALFLNTKACSLDEFIEGVVPSHGERPVREREGQRKQILVVDDSVHSGVSLGKTKQRLGQVDLSQYDVKYLAIYAREQAKTLVDYYFQIVQTPRFFQWNYLNTNWVSKSCFDIDGVLCVDPTAEENDDGENYREFLLTAKPLFIPNYKIHALVTSRLEKYRPETEQWLRDHDVQYDQLIMLNLPSKEERIRQNAHAGFKAKIYAEDTDAVLFVESERNQAIEIARRTGKPCICVATDELFDDRNLPAEPAKLAAKRRRQDTRILLYSHELTYTGAPHSLLRIGNILKRARYQVEIWAPEEGDFRAEIEKSGIQVRIVPYRELQNPQYAQKMKSFDLAIANTVIAHRFYEAASKIIPTIWFIREAQNLPDICDSVPLRKNLLCVSPDLYCVSEYAKEFIQKNYNSRVNVLHNCVEDYYSGPMEKTDSRINFIAVGTFNKRKAFDVCYDAFSGLPTDLQNKSHFYFAGRLNESSRDFWGSLVEKIQENPNTTYLGEITDTEQKISTFREMDVFVVVSRDESCSLVVLEGAMLEKPLIVSENVGAKYLVDDTNGWVVRTGDVENLRDVMAEIIRKPERLKQMGEMSRKKYLETSTIQIYEKNILRMVEQKLNESKREKPEQDTSIQVFRFNQLQMENKVLQKEIRNIHASASYRIGRFITFIPRKIRGGVRCYREHGWRYTWQRVLVHLGVKEDPYK